MTIQKYHLIGSSGDLNKLMAGIRKYYYCEKVHLRQCELTNTRAPSITSEWRIGRFKEGSDHHDQENIVPFEGARVIKKKNRYRFERVTESLNI